MVSTRDLVESLYEMSSPSPLIICVLAYLREVIEYTRSLMREPRTATGSYLPHPVRLALVSFFHSSQKTVTISIVLLAIALFWLAPLSPAFG